MQNPVGILSLELGAALLYWLVFVVLETAALQLVNWGSFQSCLKASLLANLASGLIVALSLVWSPRFGVPGLIACVCGALIAFGVPFNTTVNGYTSQQTFPVGYGIGLLCLSIIFVAIPIVVGVLTLRKKKVVAPADVLPPSEPLPPAA